MASRTRPRRTAHPLVASLGRERNPVRRLARILGPGFVTGASDDDPSGIATYANAGAGFGFGLLWTAVLTFPLMTAIQYVCAKIGMVSGRGLAGILRIHYPRPLLYAVVGAVFVANTINVGADLGAIAASANLLVPAIPPAPAVIPIALAILALQIFGSYRLISRIFRWLGFVLVAYLGAAILAHPDLGAVLAGTIVPSLSLGPAFLTTLVAILGTTISPYLFFWQASQEVEDEKSVGRVRLWQRRGATDRELEYAGLDVTMGMLFSNVVMYFVILATGATLHAAGTTSIGSADEAAQALRPLAGDLASALLAIGLIGGGVLAVPVLSGSAAYALAEAFGWRGGLDERPGRAREFYLVMVVATVVGAAIPLLGLNVIDALVGTAVINGLVAPPLLALIMLIAGDRRIMGDRVNDHLTRTVGWLTVGLMGAAAVALVATTIAG